MKTQSVQLALCLLLGALVACQASSLESAIWFPDNPTLEFFPGKVAQAVMGARNPSSKGVNITAAFAQLALVSNPEGSIYNFSGTAYQTPELSNGDETVLEYSLFLPPNMPARDFILRVYLWVNAAEEFDAVLLFNETVSVIEEPKLVDTELLGLYAILLALVAAAAYGVMTLAQGKGWVKKSKKSKVAAVVASTDKSEWLKGTVADKTLKKQT